MTFKPKRKRLRLKPSGKAPEGVPQAVWDMLGYPKHPERQTAGTIVGVLHPGPGAPGGSSGRS